jgi:cysteine desulfurase / selenocysteine lyase
LDPLDKYIYLNNAATSFPKPEEVIKGVSNVLRKPVINDSRSGIDSKSKNIVQECRKQLAALFNAPDPNRIVFTSGATESINLFLRGLLLNGRHVVATAVEHNSVLRPLKTMQREGLITLSIVECDNNGYVIPEKIEKLVNRDTGALVVNHCSNVTGIVNDLMAIGMVASKYGIPFIVDASQSSGVYPIDVKQMNIDMLAFTGHKSLYGIQGIGGAYISESIDLRPLKVGGTGVHSDNLFQPEAMPMRYEAGTQNIPGIYSLYEGVSYILDKGIDQLRKRREELTGMMKLHLSQYDNVTTYPDSKCSQNTTLFSFNIKGMDPSDTGYILENSFRIITRAGLHCAPIIHKYIGTSPNGTVRVSPSHFTTLEEVGTFNNAVSQIQAMVK